MNYLAHIYLSGDNKDIAFGGFIADAVKGKSYQRYPVPLQTGILLHRRIDYYTDNHPIVTQMIAELRPLFGRYSVILPDIFFDHFLAVHFSQYSRLSLRRYSFGFYMHTIRRFRWLPFSIKCFIWHFILTDRLGKYAKKEGIKESLLIMVRSRELDLDVDAIMSFFDKNYIRYEKLFFRFFPQLIDFSREIK